MDTIRTPKTLPQESIDILNARLVDEYTAHFFYTNARNWCANANYQKATAFFEAELNSELGHANTLQKYLTDWNTIPTLPTVKPNIEFTSLIDIINKAYAIEYSLFEKYTKDSATLFTTDLNTFDFLTQFRNIQNQSVIEYSDLLNAANLVDVNNKLDVLFFERKYFKQ